MVPDRLVIASAHELVGRGLRANVINPGPIDTRWMTGEIRIAGVFEQLGGTLGTTNDTSSIIRFLLSEQGRWINGQLLYSNGGSTRGAVFRS